MSSPTSTDREARSARAAAPTRPAGGAQTGEPEEPIPEHLVPAYDAVDEILETRGERGKPFPRDVWDEDARERERRTPHFGPDGSEAKRNAKGQFLPGNKGGPGRRRHGAEYRGIFCSVLTGERFRRLCEKVCELAEQGEKWAMKEVFRYAMGRPTHRPINAPEIPIDRLASKSDELIAKATVTQSLARGEITAMDAREMLRAIEVTRSAAEVLDRERERGAAGLS